MRPAGHPGLTIGAMLALVVVVAAARAAATPMSRESSGAQDRLDAAMSRCLESSDLVACGAALSMRPNDPGLLVAEGDALLHSGRPGEAIGVYRNAVKSGAAQDAVDPKIAVAQGHRRPLLEECETEEGAAAERACASAWLPGASDEVTVFKRRGLLLQSANRPGESLESYLAAARLAPRDRDVARAVVALSGGTDRLDVPTLTARGAALMTLGRPADAILPLREALRLAPDDLGAKARLRTAEAALAARRRDMVTAATLPATQRESAVQGDGAFSNEAPVTQSN